MIKYETAIQKSIPLGLSIIMLFTLLSCSSVEPKPTAAPSVHPQAPPPSVSEIPSHSAPVTDSIYTEDYELFWTVLEENYSLLPVVERMTGKKPQEIKARYANKLSEINNAQDFYYTIIAPCIAEFKGLGHLFVISKNDYLMWYKSWSNILDEIEDPKTEYNFNVFNMPQVKEFYGLPDNSPLTVDTPEEPVSVEQLSIEIKTSDNLKIQYFPDKLAAVVTIYRMTLENENNDNENLLEFFNQIEREGYQHCIIDIRYNEGGSDLYWRKNIIIPNISENIEWSQYALVKGPLSESFIINAGYEVCDITLFPFDLFPEVNSNDLDGITGYMKQTMKFAPLQKSPAFKGKFWVLTSPYTYSSSEMFAAFCNETGFATLVGSRTGGSGIGITPIVVSLPNTGICFRFSTGYGLNSDGSSNDEFGTQPEYVSKFSDASDALDLCLNIISTNKNLS